MKKICFREVALAVGLVVVLVAWFVDRQVLRDAASILRTRAATAEAAMDR